MGLFSSIASVSGVVKEEKAQPDSANSPTRDTAGFERFDETFNEIANFDPKLEMQKAASRHVDRERNVGRDH